MTDDQYGRGPSWYDVQKQMEWLEREYIVSATFFMHPHYVKKTGYRGLLLVLRGEYAETTTGRPKVLTVSNEWPNKQHKTMPGAIMALAHSLSEKLCALAEDLDFVQQPIK